MDSDYLMKNLSNEEEKVRDIIIEIIEAGNQSPIIFEFVETERITEQNVRRT